MKVKVTVEAILDTENVANENVKRVIERATFNREKDNLAEMWALSAVVNCDKKISLELL